MTNFDDMSRYDDAQDERPMAREIASRFLDAYPVVFRAATALTIHEIALLARVVRRHCAEAPRPAVIVAGPHDRTMPNGHVLGVVDQDISDGVCVATGSGRLDVDLETTRAVARTRMVRCADGSAVIVKVGR